MKILVTGNLPDNVIAPLKEKHQVEMNNEDRPLDHQMLTDHARRDSVMKYTEVKVEAKRKIVADIIRLRRHSVGTKAEENT